MASASFRLCPRRLGQGGHSPLDSTQGVQSNGVVRSRWEAGGLSWVCSSPSHAAGATPPFVGRADPPSTWPPGWERCDPAAGSLAPSEAGQFLSPFLGPYWGLWGFSSVFTVTDLICSAKLTLQGLRVWSGGSRKGAKCGVGVHGGWGRAPLGSRWREQLGSPSRVDLSWGRHPPSWPPCQVRWPHGPS